MKLRYWALVTSVRSAPCHANGSLVMAQPPARRWLPADPDEACGAFVGVVLALSAALEAGELLRELQSTVRREGAKQPDRIWDTKFVTMPGRG